MIRRKKKTTTQSPVTGWNPVPPSAAPPTAPTAATAAGLGPRAPQEIAATPGNERPAEQRPDGQRPDGKRRGKAPRPAAMPRRSPLLDRWGYYEPQSSGTKSTTRQAEALNVAIAAPPTTPRGLIVGQDAETGQLVLHDQFQAYADKLISSPNCVVLGDVGKAKSSLLKTWGVLRQLMLGRQVVVVDKKPQDGLGEYTPLARFFGVEPIRFTLDGSGSRINILDPVISDSHRTGEGNPAGQMMLLRATLAEALRREVGPREGKALRVAHQAALAEARDSNREGLIGDVVRHMLEPSEQAAAAAHASVAELREWGLDAAFELERMVEEDLAGLIDAPTSPNVQLGAQLTVFDVSALPETGPALPIVMNIINTWLLNTLATRERRTQTVFVAEEGWHLVEGHGFASLARRNWKLARGLGLSNVVALHHVSDIPNDSPAIAMLKEAETIFLYGQAKTDDVNQCVQLFNLPETAREVLLNLPQGSMLMKIGNRDPIIVSHRRSAIEVELTDTDSAMIGDDAVLDQQASLP